MPIAGNDVTLSFLSSAPKVELVEFVRLLFGKSSFSLSTLSNSFDLLVACDLGVSAAETAAGVSVDDFKVTTEGVRGR